VDVQGTTKNVGQDTRSEKFIDKYSILDQNYVEVVLSFPTLEFTLNVEEIPPLDIFYSPQHKAVVKRGRKKINLKQSQ